MPEYRRAFMPGGTFFFTLCTYERRPLFVKAGNVELLRRAVAQVKAERPFGVLAAVILPDHLHWLWSLPEGDADFSSRIGRIKVLFSKALKKEEGNGLRVLVASAHPTRSRRRHREGDVWQRRFWEHAIRDQDDFNNHLSYIHYNPVRHGLVRCPHAWEASSFGRYVEKGMYPRDWCCACDGARVAQPYPEGIAVGG